MTEHPKSDAAAQIPRAQPISAAPSLDLNDGSVGARHAVPAPGSHDPSSQQYSSQQQTRGGMSRREFARRAAIASAITPIAAWAPAATTSVAPPAQAPAGANSAQAAAPSTQTAHAPNLPKLSPESQAEVEARIQSILAQYGSRLSDAQQNDIRRLCTLAQPPLDRMRAYHLENADGPALYLKPLVEREKKPATSASTPAAAKPAAKKP